MRYIKTNQHPTFSDLSSPVTPVHPSSPDSDPSKNPSRPKLSKEAKFRIGLLLAVIILAGAGFLAYYAYLALFPKNPRLVVRSVRITGTRNWNPDDPDKRQAQIDRICSILNIERGKTQMFPGDSGKADLPAMIAKLQQEIPELEEIRIYRVLPDQLMFELRERTPAANLDSFYIDDSGVVLDKAVCGDISDSLPILICKPSIARGSDDSSPFRRGETLSSTAIRTALTFIRLAEKREFTEKNSEANSRISIEIKHIYITDHIHCSLHYNGDPREFMIELPLSVTEKQFRSDYFGRMIPALEEASRNRSGDNGQIQVDLRYKNVPVRKY